jgi:hypothetical protein
MTLGINFAETLLARADEVTEWGKQTIREPPVALTPSSTDRVQPNRGRRGVCA